MDRAPEKPPKSVLDSRDLSGFLASLRGSARWGCQARGAQNSDDGFSSIRIRVQDEETGRWHIRELRAEDHDGVARIGYYATEYESEEAETTARRSQ